MIRNKMKSRSIIIAFILINSLLSAQNINTLDKAKELNAQHKYKTSIDLLAEWTKTHQDVNSLWYYAQTLHLAKKYVQSQNVYNTTIEKYPENSVLKLDSANKLAESGKFEDAIKILLPFTITKDENQTFALQSIAKTYYWQGAYDQAADAVAKALALDPQDKSTIALSKNIEVTRKKWIGISHTYSKDNQPQRINKTALEGGYYINDFATIGAKLDISSYHKDDKNSMGMGVRFFNILNFHQLKAKSHIEFGFDLLPNNDASFNGLVLLKKHLYRHLGAEVNASRKPYLLTNIALDKKIMENTYGMAFTWNDPNGYMARTAIDFNRYNTEDNSYYTTSVWALSPVMKRAIYNFRVGYGFSYSASKTSTFTSTNSLEDIIQTHWDHPKLPIDGYYAPIFTPSKQLVNTAIASVDIKPIDKLKINLTGKVGFYSTTDNPYLTLNVNSNSEYYINRGFAKERYYPFEVNTSLTYDISSKFVIQGIYRYQSTNYYNIHIGGINAKYLF